MERMWRGGLQVEVGALVMTPTIAELSATVEKIKEIHI